MTGLEGERRGWVNAARAGAVEMEVFDGRGGSGWTGCCCAHGSLRNLGVMAEGPEGTRLRRLTRRPPTSNLGIRPASLEVVVEQTVPDEPGEDPRLGRVGQVRHVPAAELHPDPETEVAVDNDAVLNLDKAGRTPSDVAAGTSTVVPVMLSEPADGRVPMDVHKSSLGYSVLSKDLGSKSSGDDGLVSGVDWGGGCGISENGSPPVKPPRLIDGVSVVNSGDDPKGGRHGTAVFGTGLSGDDGANPIDNPGGRRIVCNVASAVPTFNVGNLYEVVGDCSEDKSGFGGALPVEDGAVFCADGDVRPGGGSTTPPVKPPLGGTVLAAVRGPSKTAWMTACRPELHVPVPARRLASHVDCRTLSFDVGTGVCFTEGFSEGSSEVVSEVFSEVFSPVDSVGLMIFGRYRALLGWHIHSQLPLTRHPIPTTLHSANAINKKREYSQHPQNPLPLLLRLQKQQLLLHRRRQRIKRRTQLRIVERTGWAGFGCRRWWRSGCSFVGGADRWVGVGDVSAGEGGDGCRHCEYSIRW